MMFLVIPCKKGLPAQVFSVEYLRNVAEREDEPASGESSGESGQLTGLEADEEPLGSARTGANLLVAAVIAWGAWAVIKWGGPPADVPPTTVMAGEDSGSAPEPPSASAPQTREGPSAETPSEDAGKTSDEDGAGEPIEVDPDWASGLEPPDTVAYTVRHGGSIKNVANLFKIYHHEIQALNPGKGLDEELPPGSPVVVYRRRDGAEAASIGFPGAGKLANGMPMPEGPGRVLKMVPWKSWGTPQTIAAMDGILKQWASRHPDAMPILVGNLSAPGGGKLSPHSTHQSGRDVDLGYPQIPGVDPEYNWREMTEKNLDAARTWDLLRILAESGSVEVVFIDREIQKLLHDHALKNEKMTPSELKRWLDVSGGGSRALVQHVAGHVDHMHVRIACPAEDQQCKSRTHS